MPQAFRGSLVVSLDGGSAVMSPCWHCKMIAVRNAGISGKAGMKAGLYGCDMKACLYGMVWKQAYVAKNAHWGLYELPAPPKFDVPNTAACMKYLQSECTYAATCMHTQTCACLYTNIPQSGHNLRADAELLREVQKHPRVKTGPGSTAGRAAEWGRGDSCGYVRVCVCARSRPVQVNANKKSFTFLVFGSLTESIPAAAATRLSIFRTSHGSRTKWRQLITLLSNEQKRTVCHQGTARTLWRRTSHASMHGHA
eukprot:1159970-Pelagomonas_calceolata.AAC.9